MPAQTCARTIDVGNVDGRTDLVEVGERPARKSRMMNLAHNRWRLFILLRETGAEGAIN